MEKSLEDILHQSITVEDQDAVLNILQQGVNPNKVTTNGKTCLGEACSIGNLTIVKLLLDTCKPIDVQPKTSANVPNKIKSQKRKLKHSGPSDEKVKCKNPSDRYSKDTQNPQQFDKRKLDNQGYYVFTHSESSSSDEGKLNKTSPTSSSSVISTPSDLEWDEDIGKFAPTTKEDETWTSMYQWYAKILERTGPAIASVPLVIDGIDHQDAFMRTALHYAAEQGHTTVVKLLLDSGCKTDIPDSDGLTALHIAVRRNHVDIVRHLIEAGTQVNHKTHERMTPLHFAATRGYLDLVKLLVINGALLEARDTNERSALYLAASRGHVDVVEYLILAGANVNGEEIHGYTPLCEAVWQKFTGVVELLLKANARITHSHSLLHHAIAQRQEEIVKLLASHGSGINLRQRNGNTPLLSAVQTSSPNIVKILLENGANVNYRNSITGYTPLHVAVVKIEDPNEFEEMLKTLLLYNIDINRVTLCNDTALNRAISAQKDSATVLLIRHGADVNAFDGNICGLDNLSIACARRSSQLANLLIKAGHRINRRNSKKPNQKADILWLHNACKVSLGLFDLCRLRIRSFCKDRPLFLFINELPVPKPIKRLLMLEDEGFFMGS